MDARSPTTQEQRAARLTVPYRLHAYVNAYYIYCPVHDSSGPRADDNSGVQRVQRNTMCYGVWTLDVRPPQTLHYQDRRRAAAVHTRKWYKVNNGRVRPSFRAHWLRIGFNFRHPSLAAPSLILHYCIPLHCTASPDRRCRSTRRCHVVFDRCCQFSLHSIPASRRVHSTPISTPPSDSHHMR